MMKKIVSILLAVLMITATLACCGVAFADDDPVIYTCTCTNCLKNVDCKCCVYCTYGQKRMACITFDETSHAAIFCCESCEGFMGCRCGENPSLCDCDECKLENQGGSTVVSGNTQIFDSETQKQIINTFRSIMEKIYEIFDGFFTTIEEFLRIDEFFGTSTEG